MTDDRANHQMQKLDGQLNDVMRRFDKLNYETNWDVDEPTKSRLHRALRDVYRDKASVLRSMRQVDPSMEAVVARETSECDRLAREQDEQIGWRSQLS